MQLGHESLPAAFYELIGAARFREAADLLRGMARGGDGHAASALDLLELACMPERDRQLEHTFERRRQMARNQRMPEEALARLEHTLALERTDQARIRKELCAEPHEGWPQDRRGEAQAVPAARPAEGTAFARAPSPEELRQMQERARVRGDEALREAAAGGDERAALQLAMQLMAAPDVQPRSEAVSLLRSLQSTSPRAQEMLAHCILAECVPDAGDVAEAERLLLAAARAGYEGGLRALANQSTSRPNEWRERHLGWRMSEHYAWRVLYDELREAGCLGWDGYVMRLAAPPAESLLLGMSPAEAEEAGARARELLAAELPAIRAHMSCR